MDAGERERLGFVSAGRTSDYEPGAMRAVRVGVEEVAVVNAGRAWYAFSNYCTHEGLSFSAGYGEVAGNTVMCLQHNSVFDMASGQPLGGPAYDPLKVYEVMLEGEDVWVRAK